MVMVMVLATVRYPTGLYPTRSKTVVRAVEPKKEHLVGHMAENKNTPVGSNSRFCGF